MKHIGNKKKKSGRMQRETETVAVMIHKYCRLKHGGANELCRDCTELLDYANQRLAHCPFQEGKTTCGNCQVHCYKPSMREKIREVMRTIGPRMILSNPIMALQHAMDGLRKEPIQKKMEDG
ncbi:MAG: nitrous oxide-stimulated promoter family protein [Candidatus Electrothrix aestuarii]|uniref:Nitrous oxide-stimulated promoter family protein n=1 Tax=Candidatus Electrothrix aestuarii TaxID=3062594 RepID=A0AAU8LQP9_9BACT|nr:nitrous oxide-stimulated promoter family protein [Candidatus Electrothrix aestuarii]